MKNFAALFFLVVTFVAISFKGFTQSSAHAAEAAIMISQTSGLVTTENGGQATFTIVLNTEPTADVTIGISSSDETEGMATPASLTFTAVNWDSPQTVTITGVDDVVDDGDVFYSVITAAAVSHDANYNGINPADVSVTNQDNDSAGITVIPTSGLITTENGGQSTFAVGLNTEPVADVTIVISSSNEAEGTISPSILSFTSSNWTTFQTVTITGVDDMSDDGDVVYTIITGAALSGDAHYNGINPDDVTVTNQDNDSIGITVIPTSGLNTNENGTQAFFTIVLNTKPLADVTVDISSSDETEGTVSPATALFTTITWSNPQSIIITGIDDFLDDGDRAYTIITGAAVSHDTNYNGINPPDVSVTNQDNDSAGITINPTSGLITSEAGGQAAFTAVLNSQPSADVIIGILSSDETEGIVSPSSLTFTSVTWSSLQSVTITGVDDDIDDESVYTIITTSAVSNDPDYNGINPADVSVTNQDDNDSAGITISAASDLTTDEEGRQAAFTIVLNSEPVADVSIGISSSDETEGTVSSAAAIFTSLTWSSPKTITVTGVDDDIDDGDREYTIIISAAQSDDVNYNGIDSDDIAVTNQDNGDSAGITVDASSDLTTDEGGGQAIFTIVLHSEPVANVSIGISSSDDTEGALSTETLTFTPDMWDSPHIVTITGVDDYIDDGNGVYTIVIAAALSDDTHYNGLNPDDVSVINHDDDSAGITVSPTTGLSVNENGQEAVFTIVLDTEPTADVIIGILNSDRTEGEVSASRLTFTPANWHIPQSVTIRGIDDSILTADMDDGDVEFTIYTTAAVSADITYHGMNAEDVSVINIDNDEIADTDDISFTGGLYYRAGDEPCSVIINDFNQDEKMDLAIPNFGSDNVSILFGRGDGTFYDANTYETGDGPCAVTSRDFNRDGYADLAIANRYSYTISVFIGNENGNFSNARSYQAGNSPWSITAEDFNGDSAPDIAVANWGSDNVSILLNNGNGTFKPAINYPAGDGSLFIISEDFNRDDRWDLAVANYYSDTVSILSNNENMAFMAPVHYSVGEYPKSITSNDFNGDESADLAVANWNSNTISILLGNGDGTFTATHVYAAYGPSSLTSGDFNGDGSADLAIANSDYNYISIRLGNGNGTFTDPVNFSVGDKPGSIAAQDLNADNKVDLVVVNQGSDDIAILLNDANFPFIPQQAEDDRVEESADTDEKKEKEIEIPGCFMSVLARKPD